MRKDSDANDAGMDADGGGMRDAVQGAAEMDATEGHTRDAATLSPLQ